MYRLTASFLKFSKSLQACYNNIWPEKYFNPEMLFFVPYLSYNGGNKGLTLQALCFYVRNKDCQPIFIYKEFKGFQKIKLPFGYHFFYTLSKGLLPTYKKLMIANAPTQKKIPTIFLHEIFSL